MIPILDDIIYMAYILEIVLIMLALVIIVHAAVVMLWGYGETGDALLYLKNFYHNVYHIDF